MRVVVSLKTSLEENASLYYDAAKKAKKKIEGATEALKKAKKKRALIQKKEEKEKIPKTVPVKKEWFEKFRWFISSEGFLVIGGRDATTNEIVIKKHTDSHDLVFHTDMSGSPFFVIKTEGKKPKGTIREVADATVTFSRAWKNGLLTTDVFCVSPDQVTKEANTGEFLPKGAFMIRGKTNYIDNSVNLAVGLFEGRIMAGPVVAIEKNCAQFIILIQGKEKASSVAKKIKYTLGGELDDIIRVLPSGTFSSKN